MIEKIFPSIVASITGHPRYKDIARQPSSYWASVPFAFWERIAWRRYGLRIETTTFSTNGKSITYAHSWESALCLIEQKIRDIFHDALKLRVKPFRIYVPMLATPHGFAIPASPYLFALAVDSTGTGNNSGTASSGSFNFTNTAGTLLYVGGVCASGHGFNSIAYNTVAMARVVESAPAFDAAWFRLLNPSTGSQATDWTLGGNDIPTFVCISFTGNDTTSPDGASIVTGGSSSTPTTNLITLNANSYIIGLLYFNALPTITAGTNYTKFADFQNASDPSKMAGEYRVAATATTYAVDFSVGGLNNLWIIGAVEVKAAAVVTFYVNDMKSMFQ